MYVDRVFLGSCEAMTEIPDGVVDTCVTSPPYWGLRAYGGDDGMIGLEETVDEHLDRLVRVFREVWRVLKPTGTLWLNYGDAYAGSWGAQGRGDKRSEMEIGGRIDGDNRKTLSETQIIAHPKRRQTASVTRTRGCKPKDLIGLPWHLAFALREDGWYLRSDIVWHKPNPMPESVTDRPTRSHEFIFLLSKSSRYYYDADAIREPLAESSLQRINQATFDQQTGGPKDYGPASNRSMRKTLENFREKTAQTPHAGGRRQAPEPGEPNAFHPLGANKRDVWTVATAPYPGAHFATFPRELITPCILAGCPPRCCSRCGAPYNRSSNGPRSTENREFTAGFGQRLERRAETRGWAASCECNADVASGLVLDPFMGSGTVAEVAKGNGRHFVGYEINPEYHALIQDRLGLFGAA